MSNSNDLTNQQKLTAFGLLSAVGLAFYMGNNVPVQYTLIGSIGFGIGTSLSVGFYRVANLMKSGRAEQNKFGNGFLAGSSIFCALMSLNIVPQISNVLIKSETFKNTNEAYMLPLLVFMGLVGFFQNRANTLTSIIND